MKQVNLFHVDRSKEADVVLTPKWVARDIVEHFRPRGTVLDPCRGNGAFSDLLPGCEWCEIREGRDFYAWETPVDWIVGNPPYSEFGKWMAHSIRLAVDVVYLVPIYKVWQSDCILASVRPWGGIVETRVFGSGRRVGFPFGFSCGAVHFQRGYDGPMRLSFPCSG